MAIIEDFDQNLPLLNDFSPKLQTLLEELLAAKKSAVHSIGSRVKTRDSLLQKLQKRPGKYQQLSQITDLCGARIITYFEDAVDTVVRVIEAEFEIDFKNSVDKRSSLDDDRFGYVSVNYIACLKDSRTGLPEYARFKDIKFELQIRSILQHTWAEIEHDLQYKERPIPRELRRRFARLAGLLEIADAEFMGIRDAILHLPAPTHEVAEHQLNLESMKSLIRGSPLVADLDQRIAATIGVPVIGETVENGFAFRTFTFLNIATIETIEASLTEKSERIIRFATAWLERPDPQRVALDSLPRGISLDYLAFNMILEERPSPLSAADVIRSVGLRDGIEADELAEALQEAFRRVS